MAIDLGQETPTLQVIDRATAVYIFIDDNDNVQFEFTREVVRKDAQGRIVHRRQVATVRRSQDQVGTKQYTAGGVTRTGNQILLLLNQMSDVERQLDINNGP